MADDNKTYTQAEVEQIKHQASEKAFAKAKEKFAKQNELEQKQNEIEELKKFKQDTETKNLLSSVTKEIKELEDNGGLKSYAMKSFVKNHANDLKGLKGEKLESKLNKIYDKFDEDDKKTFFNIDDEFSSSKSLTKEDKEKGSSEEYYPGSTIRRRT